MKIIAKFKLGKVMYVIVLKNNKYKVGRLTNNIVNYNLSNQEKTLITHVINGILPNNFKTILFPIKVNGNKYDVSVSNGIYEFYPVPNMDDLKVLNNLLNNQNEFVYFGKNSNTDSNYVKRFVNLGKKTVLVLLSATILLSSTSCMKSDIEEQFNDDKEIISELPDDDKIITIIDEPSLENEEIDVIEIDELTNEVVEEIQNDFDNKEKEIEVALNTDNITETLETENNISEENIVKQYNFNDFLEAVNSNPNLTEAEKNHILSCSFIFEDNYGYYTYENILKSLGTLKVEYTSEKIGSLGGTYTSGKNLIKMYDSTCYEDASFEVFSHEFSHLIQASNNYCTTNYNTFLDEGTNEIATIEYYYADEKNPPSNSYSFQCSIVRALSLILGDDIIKKYYNFNDTREIEQALYKIYPDEERVTKFLDMLVYYQNLQLDVTYARESNNEEVFKEIENYVKQELRFYYETKYQRSVEDDLLMLYFVDYDGLVEKIKTLYNVEEAESYTIMMREKPNIISTAKRDVNYTLEFQSNYTIGYDVESYEDCLNGGLIDEEGNTYIVGLIIDKENNQVLRPHYGLNSFEIEMNDANRYVSDNLSR